MIIELMIPHSFLPPNPEEALLLSVPIPLYSIAEKINFRPKKTKNKKKILKRPEN
jgi:hypothetical protein